MRGCPLRNQQYNMKYNINKYNIYICSELWQISLFSYVICMYGYFGGGGRQRREGRGVSRAKREDQKIIELMENHRIEGYIFFVDFGNTAYLK